VADVTHKVLDGSGKEVGTIKLDPEIFGAPGSKAEVHATVRWQLTKRRAGTHSCLTKGMMKGGNRKPFKQKGTGQARAGSNTSPLWVGGGVSHGPHPRSYEHRLNKRTRRQALGSILADKLQNGQLFIVDGLKVDGKSAKMAAVLEKLGIAGKGTAIVLADASSKGEAAIARASRNLERVVALQVNGVNAYDLLRHPYVVSTKDGIEALQARIKGKPAKA
jgi:large subunit ribosomal protein L4